MPAINIPDHLYNEFILREGRSVNVEAKIQALVRDHLRDAKGKKAGKNEKKCGPPDRGFQWKALFLPNGTLLKMLYQDQEFVAEVRNEVIHFNGRGYNSPSLLASHIANNTSRNAWRDFAVKRPGDGEFTPAFLLRREAVRNRRFRL